ATANGGAIHHAGAGVLTVSAQNQLNNSLGEIASVGDVTVNGGDIDNSGGNIFGRDITLAGNTFNNTLGLLESAGETMRITVSDTLDNTTGDIVHTGEGNLVLTVGATLTNSAGRIDG